MSDKPVRNPYFCVSQPVTIDHMRIQVRVPDELGEELEAEAEELGYDNLSSYLRWIINERDGTLRERVDELEERVTALEQQE